MGLKFEDLALSEKEIGQIYPVIKDGNGKIIDGFHRKRINPNWKEIVLPIKTDVEALRLRVHLNVMRRKVPRSEKMEWVKEAKRILQKQGYENPTIRQIANLLGVSHKTVVKWNSFGTTGTKQTVEKPLFNVWGFKTRDWRKLVVKGDPEQPDVDFYHGATPAFVIHNLIQLYKPKTVLDSMAGIGTTGYVCRKYGIDCDLFDIYPFEKYGVKQCDAEYVDTGKTYDLIFNHIPYLDMVVYGNDPNDLSKMNINDFIDKLTRIFKHNLDLLNEDGVFAVLVGDKRFGGKLYPLIAKTTDIALNVGFELFDEAVKLTREQKSSGLQEYRASKYGYMAQTFDMILIFKKR